MFIVSVLFKITVTFCSFYIRI